MMRLNNNEQQLGQATVPYYERRSHPNLLTTEPHVLTPSSEFALDT